MIPWWWSWLLTLIGVTGLLFAGSKKKFGWLIGVFAQVFWIAYALTTEQYGFVPAALIYGATYGRNYLRWRKDERGLLPPS